MANLRKHVAFEPGHLLLAEQGNSYLDRRRTMINENPVLHYSVPIRNSGIRKISFHQEKIAGQPDHGGDRRDHYSLFPTGEPGDERNRQKKKNSKTNLDRD